MTNRMQFIVDSTISKLPENVREGLRQHINAFVEQQLARGITEEKVIQGLDAAVEKWKQRPAPKQTRDEAIKIGQRIYIEMKYAIITGDHTFTTIEGRIDAAIEEAKQKITIEEVRDEIVKHLAQMKNRTSEHTAVAENCCHVCGREIGELECAYEVDGKPICVDCNIKRES